MKIQDILIQNFVFAPFQRHLNGAMELLVDLARVISDAEHSVGATIWLAEKTDEIEIIKFLEIVLDFLPESWDPK